MNKKRTIITLLAMLFFANSTFAQKKEIGYYISGQDEKIIILNEAGKPITKETFEYVGGFSDNLFPVQKNGKYGFIDIKGTMVVPCQYIWASEMRNGVAIVQLGEKYGLIDKKGKYKIKPQYENLQYENFNNGLATFKKDGLEGAVERNGKVIIPNEFEYIAEFHKGYAVAKKNGKIGLINTEGKTVIPYQYEYVSELYNAFSFAFREGENSKMGLMDLKGNVLLNPEYDFIFPWEDGMVYLRKGNKQGVADKYGTILLPAEYKDIHKLSDEMMLLEKDEKYGFANSKGEITIPLIYKEAQDFSEGLAPVLKDGKWGCINQNGETIIDFKFVGVMMPFYKGFAAYGKRHFSSGAHYTSDVWGLIDKKGNIVIENKYQSIAPGYNGNFVADLKDKRFLLNDKGETVVELKYEGHLVVEMQMGN